MTVIAIHKTTSPSKTGIAISAPQTSGASATTVAPNAFTYTMPAMSVSVLTQLILL